jgi:predicted Fe-Mo cluster-binding NifX family protein
MRLAISVNQPEPAALLERRFGRCRYFLIVDPDSHNWEVEPNPGADASGGAGPRAVQFLADRGVDAVLSGDFGPKAFAALQASGIRVYSVAQEDSAENLLEKYLSGQFKRVAGSISR